MLFIGTLQRPTVSSQSKTESAYAPTASRAIIATANHTAILDHRTMLRLGFLLTSRANTVGTLALLNLHYRYNVRLFAFNAAATRLTGGRPSSRLMSLVAASSFAMSTSVAIPMPSSM